MGVLVVAEHLFTDLVKLLALSQQIPQMLGQQALLRAGGKAVQHEHPACRGSPAGIPSAASWAAL